MIKEYSHFSAKSSGAHYSAIALPGPRGKMGRMGSETTLRRRLLAELEAQKMSVNALATKIGMRESTIRAVINGDTNSARIDTLDKLAAGLGVSTASLLGVDQTPLNEALLAALLKRLLRSIYSQDSLIEQIAQSLVRAYAIALDTGVNPHDPRDLDILTGTEVDRLRLASTRSKS